MSEEAEKMAERLEALVIMDEVRSDNSLGREAASLMRSQAERIRVLEAALEPFARIGQHMKYTPAHREADVCYIAREADGLNSGARSPAKVEDFHRARAAMEPRNG